MRVCVCATLSSRHYFQRVLAYNPSGMICCTAADGQTCSSCPCACLRPSTSAGPHSLLSSTRTGALLLPFSLRTPESPCASTYVFMATINVQVANSGIAESASYVWLAACIASQGDTHSAGIVLALADVCLDPFLSVVFVLLVGCKVPSLSGPAGCFMIRHLVIVVLCPCGMCLSLRLW